MQQKVKKKMANGVEYDGKKLIIAESYENFSDIVL